MVYGLKFFDSDSTPVFAGCTRLRSDSETFVSFALRLLLKLHIDCYKLYKKCSKLDPCSLQLRLFVNKMQLRLHS